MKLSIMIDTDDSFMKDYISELIEKLENRGHVVSYITSSKDISRGDCLFLLSCGTILSREQLSLHKHNLVVHPTKLPKGRGSAPIVWQILEGKNSIYFTLFEAVEKVDRGPYYFQEKIKFKGDELSDEIRYKQAMKTFELVIKFVDNYPNNKTIKQKGKATYTPKRRPSDSELNIDKTIREQFNLLRVSDNERYPSFFIYKGNKYILKIYKQEMS